MKTYKNWRANQNNYFSGAIDVNRLCSPAHDRNKFLRKQPNRIMWLLN